MKKITSILLMTIYLLISVGVSINVHNCNGRFAFVEILTEIGNCCCDHEKEASNCCDDENIVIQMDQDVQIIQSNRLAASSPFVITRTFAPIAKLFGAPLNIHKEIIVPPPPPNQPIWLVNSSLIFYG